MYQRQYNSKLWSRLFKLPVSTMMMHARSKAITRSLNGGYLVDVITVWRPAILESQPAKMTLLGYLMPFYVLLIERQSLRLAILMMKQFVSPQQSMWRHWRTVRLFSDLSHVFFKSRRRSVCDTPTMAFMYCGTIGTILVKFLVLQYLHPSHVRSPDSLLTELCKLSLEAHWGSLLN